MKLMENRFSSDTILPKYPYRSLASFRYIDRNIFAGRTEDIGKIYRLILQYRGILIYGDSGVGKSSLINAGLLSKLIDTGKFSPELIRINPNPEGTFIIQKTKNSDDTNSFLDSIFSDSKSANSDGKIILSFNEFEAKVSGFKSKKYYVCSFCCLGN